MPVIPPSTPALPTALNPKSLCPPWPLSCLAHIQASGSLADPHPFTINPGSGQDPAPTPPPPPPFLAWFTARPSQWSPCLCLGLLFPAQWSEGRCETQSQVAAFLRVKVNILLWPTRPGWIWPHPPLTSPHHSPLALHSIPATRAPSLFLKAARHTQGYLRPFALAVLVP